MKINLENISKQYRLGTVGTGTLSHDLNRWFARMRGKEDPSLKIGQANQLSQAGGDYVWALQNINLEVKKGEILGIIGKNGAGKSTLLKLLSQVTGPTTGQIKVNGRIASLLEVGTGFHPELTGRENIFLNGAILGMTKTEIRSKLDEIIEFAGVSKYVDTPVKRYSSGMYVRLAFAVAAHLEPDILVVDEVLAVGDAEFQKKAIGKMKDVSMGGGRTVLFVSHNMASVKSLCTRAILLENGRIKKVGDTDNIVAYYLSGGNSNSAQYKKFEKGIVGTSEIYVTEIGIQANGQKYDQILRREDNLEIFFRYSYNKESADNYSFNLRFKSDDGVYLFNVFSTQQENRPLLEGEHGFRIDIPGYFLKEGSYFMDFAIIRNNKSSVYRENDVLSFSINPEKREMGSSMGKGKTYLTPHFEWTRI